jgi:hypothetical protein
VTAVEPALAVLPCARRSLPARCLIASSRPQCDDPFNYRFKA